MTQVVRTQKAEAIAHFQYEGRLDPGCTIWKWTH